MGFVAWLEHFSHVTEIVMGYAAAAALVALSILSIVRLVEARQRGVSGGTYYWWQELIDIFLPLTVVGLGLWTMLNGISPDWLTLAAAFIILAAHAKYSTQWKERRV